MALMHAAYFDVSGTDSGTEKVFCIGGLVAPIEKLIRLEREWLAMLANYRIHQFHMTDMASGGGAFVGWDSEKGKECIADIAGMIHRHCNKLPYVLLEMDAWRKAKAVYDLSSSYDTPFALCGMVFVDQVRKWAKRKKIQFPIKFVCEDGDKGRGNFARLCKHQFGFEPIKETKDLSALQVADVIAWKNRRALLDALKHKKDQENPSLFVKPADTAAVIYSILCSLDKVATRPMTGRILDYENLSSVIERAGVPKR